MDKEEQFLNHVLRLREGGNVRRMHTCPHHGEYTVANHTFQMLLLLELLHPDPPIELRRAVLFHDLAERWAGDLPFPVRKLDQEIYESHQFLQDSIDQAIRIHVELEDNERRWLKAIDYLEFYLWTIDQVNLGNEHLRNALEKQEEHLRASDVPEPVTRLLDALDAHGWRRTDDSV
jgi:5'-deoxynucleotidase YfbR-like HD superfamily hydrolase